MRNIESPNHYTQGAAEVIYEIRDILGHEGFKAFCMGNWIKYNARANYKGLRAEDLAKADQYLEWATNGLPAPVNGRVPRPEQDLYAQAAREIVPKGVERTVESSPKLAAEYGDLGTPQK